MNEEFVTTLLEPSSLKVDVITVDDETMKTIHKCLKAWVSNKNKQGNERRYSFEKEYTPEDDGSFDKIVMHHTEDGQETIYDRVLYNCFDHVTELVSYKVVKEVVDFDVVVSAMYCFFVSELQLDVVYDDEIPEHCRINKHINKLYYKTVRFCEKWMERRNAKATVGGKAKKVKTRSNTLY